MTQKTQNLTYYLSLNSPWSYLGGARLIELVDRYKPQLQVLPINTGAVFEATGGLPLPKRSKQRQAYRLRELQRWRDHHGVPLVLEPKNFPSNELTAALMVLALEQSPHQALRLANAIQAALWAEDRNIGEPDVLVTAAGKAGLNGKELLAATERDRAKLEARRTEATAKAIERGLFGVPGYFVGDELFWGQDRIEFVERALAG